jgi:putative exosortase-associated protein (TIGR04073 family)
MKKALIVIVVLVAVSSAAWAQEAAVADEGPQYTVFTKFFRGVGNILKAPIEIPVTMYNVSADTDVFIGTLAGGVAGVASGAERLKAGCMDVVLCLFPPYDRSLITYELGQSPAAKAAASTFPGTDEF